MDVDEKSSSKYFPSLIYLTELLQFFDQKRLAEPKLAKIRSNNHYTIFMRK